MEIGIIIVFCVLIITFAAWRGVRVALLKKKKQLDAYEAKMIAETFDSKMRRIENGIYFDIRTSAFCGNRYVQCVIDADKDISFEIIAANLKRKGYIVSWEFSKERKSFIFDIQW